ncbi:MAG TPA: hotdog fold thioesterase [Gemmatimonadales bacterium]|nr:hotdog fold thioesterase [Gemmatimonadales bacterium]
MTDYRRAEDESNGGRQLPDMTTGLAHALGIEVVELQRDRVVATMPVDERTRQPFGLLHGGASVALAETVASLGAYLNAGEGQQGVGLEINANHIRAVTSGVVRATGTPLHLGRTTQVWSIDIRDERDRLICVSRCTLTLVKGGI